MPVKIPNNLPAANILSAENIFVMTEERAAHQDIRPLKIAILNLMPNKISFVFYFLITAIFSKLYVVFFRIIFYHFFGSK